MISNNPNAMEILEENIEKIKWMGLSENKAIFTYDYDKIKETNKNINKEIIDWYYHPLRINKWIDELEE
jgi:hypothetical protein